MLSLGSSLASQHMPAYLPSCTLAKLQKPCRSSFEAGKECQPLPRPGPDFLSIQSLGTTKGMHHADRAPHRPPQKSICHAEAWCSGSIRA